MSAGEPHPDRVGGRPAPRVVLTGGPGGGKTTAGDLYLRELGETAIIVPEAATLLFAGGFPRVDEPDAERSLQQAIFAVQHHLEDVQGARFPERVQLCDRGTVDGAAFWPDGQDEFFAIAGTDLRQELARYDAVLFFETAAVGGLSIEGGNRYRLESVDEAVALDERLRELWSQHERFYFVPHQQSFLAKITAGLAILRSVIGMHPRH
ncbi:MAG: AAA family ATPase [Actinomycetota bacterium]|nr:MAG: AAA family ATPase [Actinomycetota bacterium]